MYTLECLVRDGVSVTILRPRKNTPCHLDATRGEANRLIETMREAGIDGIVEVIEHPDDGPDVIDTTRCIRHGRAIRHDRLALEVAEAEAY